MVKLYDDGSGEWLTEAEYRNKWGMEPYSTGITGTMRLPNGGTEHFWRLPVVVGERDGDDVSAPPPTPLPAADPRSPLSDAARHPFLRNVFGASSVLAAEDHAAVVSGPLIEGEGQTRCR